MFDLPTVLLAVTAFVNAGLIAFIYTRNRTGLTNASFALFVLFLAVWALTILGFRLTLSDALALNLLKLSYVAATLIAASFYVFSIVFPDGSRPGRVHAVAIVSVTGLLSLALLLPSFLTKSVVHHTWGREVILGASEFGLFAVVFLTLFAGGQLRLWRKYLSAEGVVRVQLGFIAWSVTTIGVIGMHFNLVLPSPLFQDFRYVWTGPIFTSVFATVITYSIFRYRFFNAKAMVAELLVFALWLGMLVRTLLASAESERLSSGLLLAFSLPVGILLIRSVAQEIRAREDLVAANARLVELSRMKSELLSIVSHQLKAPVAVIRGYISMIQEGSLGKVPPTMRAAVDHVAEGGKMLASGIDDYLNVARIEQGRITYDFGDADLRQIVERVVSDFTSAAERKGLRLSFVADDRVAYVTRIDAGKMTEVVSNLLDNAIKYTPHGSIAVKLSRGDESLLLSIEDTGVGIDATILPKLFQKYVRAADASATNAGGTGLGLYVAREYVEAHGGKIWALTRGKGKGATFFVELPSRASEAS